jgi:excisionase family DNA binding protein
MTEFITAQEAAARLRVHEKTIRRWIKVGTLPAVQIGRSYRIRLEDFEQLVDTSSAS